MKKLLTLATLAAVIGGTALPAGAVTVSTPNVTVKWNITASATLAFNTDYTVSAGSSAQGASAPTIWGIDNAAAASAGTCTAPAGAPAADIVDFNQIAPSATDYIGCYYENAADAMITTNSSNWNVTEKLSAAMPTNFHLCIVPNGFTYGATNPASLNATLSAQTTQALSNPFGPNKSTGACGAGSTEITTTAGTVVSDNAAFTSGQGAHLGEDYILDVPPLAAVASNQSAIVVYTVTAN